MKERKMGEIWKTNQGWKIKLPHGVETLETKKAAENWKKVFWNQEEVK